MAETVLAGEHVKTFAQEGVLVGLALPGAIRAGLGKDLFVGNGPCNTGNRNCEHEQPYNIIV
jgi:hypothetical protein